MRQIAVSVLAMFIALPVFADVRLPVVNVAAGGVSARAAFGEPVIKKVAENKVVTESRTAAVEKEKNSEEKLAGTESVSRGVVSRAGSLQAVSMDAGEQIVASDILSPRRPSSNLWATTSSDVVPLRLPEPQEFAVIRSDALLPEESLDASERDVSFARSMNSSEKQSTVAQPMSELDVQIARLNELQKLAEESIEKVPVNTNRRVVSRNMVSHQEEKNNVSNVYDGTATEVKLAKLVVPMEEPVDEDVVVRAVQRAESPRINAARNDMTQMTPSELRKAFRKTFLSENKHLSTFQIDDRFDEASDMTVNAEGFTSARDLSEAGGIRPLEIKIKFRNEDAALSRDNYNLLTEYAGIVLSNPTRAVQVSIPQRVVTDTDDRKLAARRLAIIEQVLRDNGISEQRILPVLSQRDEEGLVLRMISLDQYETLTKQQKDIFGDTVNKKTYRSMSW